jgi:very-short-patch-repair endonuclease
MEEVHDDSYYQERDPERTKILSNFGIRELRFRNTEVLNDISTVLTKIEFVLKNSH